MILLEQEGFPLSFQPFFALSAFYWKFGLLLLRLDSMGYNLWIDYIELKPNMVSTSAVAFDDFRSRAHNHIFSVKGLCKSWADSEPNFSNLHIIIAQWFG